MIFKQKKIAILFWLLLTLIVFSVRGQSGGINFVHLSIKEGVPQSPISAMLQDNQGFIWIATKAGLIRYDGYECKIFKHDSQDTTTISHDGINALVQDKHGNLWIGTANGLNMFDRYKENFHHIDILNIKGGKNYISSLLLDKRQRLWLATNGGIRKCDPDKHKIDDYHYSGADIESLLYKTTLCTFEDSNGKFWVGTGSGVVIFDPQNRAKIKLPDVIKGNKELMSGKVTAIKEDQSKNIWFGTDNSGLYCYNVKTNKCLNYRHDINDQRTIASDEIGDILVKDNGNIWIGTSRGLSILDSRTRIVENYVHSSSNSGSLSYSAVLSFMKDYAGNVWLGTYAGGINIYHYGNSNFTNIGEKIGKGLGLNYPMVNAMMEDSKGKFWFGTEGGGLNFLDIKNNITKYYAVTNDLQKRSSNIVKAIIPKSKTSLWLGTSDGLADFNKVSGQVEFYDFKSASTKLVNCMLQTRDGLWIGTHGGGLCYLDKHGLKSVFKNNKNDKKSLTDNSVSSLLPADGDHLWIGTQNGIDYFDIKSKNVIEVFKTTNNRVNNNFISFLFKDSHGDLWAGTEGGGLNFIAKNKFQKTFFFKTTDGLADNVINGITEDLKGNLWVSTNAGISKIFFQNKNFTKIKGFKITNYSLNDGLASSQYVKGSVLRSIKGDLLFGGMNGITMFSPDRIVINSYKPIIAFTDFLVKNDPLNYHSGKSPLKAPINLTREVLLNYDQGFITIKFTALNFINPENNQYAYKLKGSKGNEDWHYAGNQHFANYTNLIPGKYIFEVKAANNDGIWNEHTRILIITIRPPFWQTWWAWTAYIIIAGVSLLIVIRFFRARTILKRALFEEHLLNERQEEIYQIKLDFFTSISHEIRTPLTLILGPLEKLIGETYANYSLNKQLLQIKNNADRLMRLIGELLDFRKAEAGHMKLYTTRNDIVSFVNEIFLSFTNLATNKGIDYTFVCEQEEIDVYFDRDQFEKVLFNLISNAFKFTPNNGRISVIIKYVRELNNDCIFLAVEDNGIGLTPEDLERIFDNFYQGTQLNADNHGTGIGLALAKKITELHGGTISVLCLGNDDDFEKKTSFQILLPASQKEYSPDTTMPNCLPEENITPYKLQTKIDSILEQESELPAAAPLVKEGVVLLVEDNIELRVFIKSYLKSWYQVLEAENGVVGFDIAIKKIPDIVISDVMMPEMDGLDLCRKLKLDDRTSHIPIVMLTARAAYIHQINGLEKGADCYITKPFSIQILLLNVRNLLAGRSAMRKKYMQKITLDPRDISFESVDEEFLRKIVILIEEHMVDDLFCIPWLASEVGMSQPVLYKKIKSLTDLSVNEFIKTIRLKRARQLLISRRFNVNEVALAVGFNDRRHFGIAFVKQFGKTPSDFLKECPNPPMIPE